MNPGYSLAALALFVVEVCIALFVRDAFVRPYVGDVLAVAFVYCCLRAVTRLGLWPALWATLLIAAVIEFAQLFGLLDALGLRGNLVARTVLGGSFDLLDLVTYAAGGLVVVVVEGVRRRRR
jgi:hypothetical protein